MQLFLHGEKRDTGSRGRPGSRGKLLYEPERVHIRPAEADLKVKMGAKRVARVACQTDQRALPDAFADRHVDLAQVRVHGDVSVAVVDHDHVAVTVVVPAGFGHHACIRREDPFTLGCGDIDGEVPFRVIVS